MKKSKLSEISYKKLNKICQESKSYREVLGKLGYSQDAGGPHAQLKNRILELGINISHFKNQRYVTNKGKFRVPISKYLNNEIKIPSHKLRLRLLQENIFQYRCMNCGLSEWMGKPIPLELHHKDGNKNNNSLNNIELRCPNCHYFTDTFGVKNSASVKAKRLNGIQNKPKKQKTKRCINCGEYITSSATYCLKCRSLKNRITKRPSAQQLEQELKLSNFRQVGNKYGVTDNAVRKWCKTYGLSIHSSDYK